MQKQTLKTIIVKPTNGKAVVRGRTIVSESVVEYTKQIARAIKFGDLVEVQPKVKETKPTTTQKETKPAPSKVENKKETK